MSIHLNATFPAVMRERLNAVRTRRTLFVLVRAAVIALTTLLVAMLVAMLVDWGVTLFDTRYRVLLTTASLLISLVTLLLSGWRPVRRAWGWTTAAEQVDKRVPQMEERWLTVASLSKTGHEPKDPAGRAMLARVTSEAVAMSRLVRPEQVVSGQILKRPLFGMGAALLTLGIFFASQWGQTSILWQRFWSPTLNITATQMKAVTGNAMVPRGQTVQLVATMEGLQRESIVLILRRESLPDQVEQLTVTQSSASNDSIRFPVDVDETMHYRIQAGDGRTDWHTLTAIDYPELKDVRLTVTPPKYVDEPVYEKTLIPSRLRVVLGSQLELAIKPQIELKSLTLLISAPTASAEGEAHEEPTDRSGETSQTLILNRGDDGWYHFETTLVSSFSMTPFMVSEYDLKNRNPRICHVTVVEDHAPVARIISPSGESSVSLDEVLDIRFEAHDDYGIATAKLVIYEDNPQDPMNPKILAERKIPLGNQALQKHVMGKFELDLKELGLQEGANISYAVRVTDNRDLEVDASSPLNQLLASMDQRDKAEIGDKHALGQSSSAKKSSTENMANSESQAVADAGQEMKSKQSELQDLKTESNGEEKREVLGHLAANESPRGEEASEKQPSDSEGSGSDKEGDSDAQAAMSEAHTGDGKASVRSDNDPSSATPQDKQAEAAGSESKPKSSLITTASEQNTLDNQGTSNSITTTSSEQPGDHPAEAQLVTSGPGTSKEDHVLNAGEKPAAAPNQSLPDEMPLGEPAPQPDGKISLVSEPTSPTPSDRSNAQPADSPQKPSNSSPRMANANPPGSPMPGGSASIEPPPTKNLRLNQQMTESGQQQETDRKRLRIVSRLDAVANSDDPRREQTKPVRDKVVHINKMLEVIEARLHSLHRLEIDDSLRTTGFQEVETLLKDVEEFITQLNESTRETTFEFVGLQMIDIASSHVTPARDAVFMAIRTPDSGANLPTEEALHHVVSARELLQALLKRNDTVAQEQQLAKELNEMIQMYTIYVERSQQLMREAQQNLDPLRLEREMEIVEVDQTYLDRLAEVTRMRRDMMSELARILSDDPRLRSRYLDLITRRRNSLSSQLAELAARQDQTAQEVTGWISVDDNQRANYWLQVSDLRLDVPHQLAKDAQQLADRIEKQLPLVLDPAVGAAAMAVTTAKQIALDARRCDLDVRQIRKSGEVVSHGAALSGNAEALVQQVGELAAALDRIELESAGLDGVSEYVPLRRIEVQAFADMADTWAITAHAVEQEQFSALASLDQHQLVIATELLRAEMLAIDTDLAGQFNEEVQMPQEVIFLTQELQRAMESITHNQASATFALIEDRMNDAATQHALTLKSFDTAQELLNQLRRKTVEALDKIQPENPNIAELQDPTLDQFLADLEREPNIEAQLGIPNRPRNIRILQEGMSWQKNGSGLLSASGEGAMARMQKAIDQRQQHTDGEDGPDQRNTAKRDAQGQNKPQQLNEEEKQQLADSKEMLKDRMAQALKDLERQASDPQKTTEQRRQLADMAAQLSRSLEEMEKGQTPEQLWRQMGEADQAKAALEALAKGEQIPDEQWNKLMSTLGDGLGQVTGRVPTEDYRKSIEQYQERIRKLTGSR